MPMQILSLTLAHHMMQSDQLSQAVQPASLFLLQCQQKIFEWFRLVIFSFEQHSFVAMLF